VCLIIFNPAGVHGWGYFRGGQCVSFGFFTKNHLKHSGGDDRGVYEL